MNRIILAVLLLLPAGVRADSFEERLEACRPNPDQAYCTSKVLLAAMREFVQPSGSSSGPPKCNCACSGMAPVTCLLYYIDGGHTTVLANALAPKDCLEALRYPPCRD